MKLQKLLALLLCLLLLPVAAPAEEEVTLQVYDWISEETLDAFAQAHPGIRVSLVDSLPGSLQDALVSGADIDVYAVSADSSFEELLSKGYAAPLENDVLVARAQRLQPALRELVLREGQLMAYPADLSLDTWTLDVTGWEEAGFAEADAPRTIVQFLDAFQLWQDEKSDDFAHRCFFEGTLEDFIRVLANQYIAQAEQADQPVSFDTPAFRDALALLDQARPLFAANAEKMDALMNGEFTAMPLIYAYGMGYGYTMLDDHLARPLAIPALTDTDTPPVKGQTRLWVCSARSAHPREAAQLIDFLAQSALTDTQYALYQDMTKPLENPRFADLLAQRTAEKAQLTAQLQSCKAEEKQALEDRLAWVESWLGRQDEIRWIITEKDIALYQSLVRGLFVPTQSHYLADGSNSAAAIDGLITRFADGETQAEGFIDGLNQICRLAYLEQ
ncbi:MAG: extracellular solute-binding protein [Eubacteriales bacterium]|nr:extracellular solute-binding protein [Eubacteriales bacterium]